MNDWDGVGLAEVTLTIRRMNVMLKTVVLLRIVGHKYEWNRQDRRTARKDVPLARLCETEEEERKQMEAMKRLEQNKEQ